MMKKLISQEEYCQDCEHFLFGACNVFLTDEELEKGCGDKVVHDFGIKIDNPDMGNPK